MRLGLAYHTWPFTVPPASLKAADRLLILERTLAVTPAPARHPEDDDG